MIILMFYPVQFAHPVSFGLGTMMPVESLDCELSENIYFEICVKCSCSRVYSVKTNKQKKKKKKKKISFLYFGGKHFC